jgi:hypothetical protein
MIKVSILYPYRENGHFDVDYYCVTHMPLAAKLFTEGLVGRRRRQRGAAGNAAAVRGSGPLPV